MEENEEQTLDSEYKRYLEIMRPYLGQLLDQDVIEICNAWIRRLSCCQQNEKILRNKYIFAMCYQLARGILEEPFLQNPTSDELTPLQGGTSTDDSVNESSEVEYVALDLDSTKTKVIFNKKNNPTTEISCSSEFNETDRSNDFHFENKNSVNLSSNKPSEIKDKRTVVFYDCPNILPIFPNTEMYNDNYYNENCYNNNEYEHRVNNLVMKLREIKMQNFLLHNELISLRDDSRLKDEHDKPHDKIIKVDNATSDQVLAHESTTTLNCLKSKLQEVQDSRKDLIETIGNLQEKLDNFNEMKRHEIEDLHAQNRLEIIHVKTSVREETKANYEKNIEELKQQHEQFIKDIQSKHLKDIENLIDKTEATIAEKDKIILSMETEITNLRNYIEGLKNNQFFMFSNFLDRSNKNNSHSNRTTQNAEELERRLNKMEKAKLKFSKVYETKLAKLQKEKHLAEYSLQLQLMKQRAQVVNETVEEQQTELANALDKLECKYKDIVANVQATAVQRRIQDQKALESIIQTVCGIRNEGLHCNIAQATYTGQLSNKATRNQTGDANESCDSELSTIMRDNKVGSVIVGNKAFANDTVLNGYCLDGEKFSELFERVCVPQRDTGESSPK